MRNETQIGNINPPKGIWNWLKSLRDWHIVLDNGRWTKGHIDVHNLGKKGTQNKKKKNVTSNKIHLYSDELNNVIRVEGLPCGRTTAGLGFASDRWLQFIEKLYLFPSNDFNCPQYGIQMSKSHGFFIDMMNEIENLFGVVSWNNGRVTQNFNILWKTYSFRKWFFFFFDVMMTLSATWR